MKDGRHIYCCEGLKKTIEEAICDIEKRLMDLISRLQ
jgi:hypothetical protein